MMEVEAANIMMSHDTFLIPVLKSHKAKVKSLLDVRTSDLTN